MVSSVSFAAVCSSLVHRGERRQLLMAVSKHCSAQSTQNWLLHKDGGVGVPTGGGWRT